MEKVESTNRYDWAPSDWIRSGKRVKAGVLKMRTTPAKTPSCPLPLSAPRVANGAHPLRGLLLVEPEVFLQRIQGLQRSELGQAVLAGLKNREQPAAFFRQSAGFFRHHSAAIDLNFQRQITHSETLTPGPPIATKS